MTTQTTSYANAGSKYKTASCGCGKKNCGGDCHCGSSSDASCGCNEGLLLQPHFFAGQLLTDDDLQAITNYMLTKQRLHNRYVVGSGVSCGLAVTCHPCGNGQVIVQPGYAIDCCGNDILVPCPLELDINAMVRDLKLKGLGHDCGDPCADAKKKEKPMDNSTRRESEPDCAEPVDRYCLYLRYCEIPTEPIAPYTQDENCATTCQPSRLREGFSFELRCPEQEDCPPSFVDRICCCIGDLNESEHQTGQYEFVQSHVRNTTLSMQTVNQEQPVQFTEADVNLLIRAHSHLIDSAPLFQQSNTTNESIALLSDSRVNATATDTAGDKPLLTEKVLRVSLDDVQTLGSAIARWDLTRTKEQGVLLEKNQGLSAQLDESRDLLAKITPVIGERAQVLLTSSIERAAVDALVANTLKYARIKTSENQTQGLGKTLYANNAIHTPAFVSKQNEVIAKFKNWLLRRMYNCPPTTECCLIAEVEAVVIPTADNFSEVNFVAVETLWRALIRYLLDCICSALIPPCPDCDDTAVKLACLEVKDCKVDNICNLERTFLLTEHNLRYWLPFLHGFGEALEKICCEFSKKFDDPIRAGKKDRFSQLTVNQQPDFASRFPLSKTVAEQPVYPNLLRLTGLADSDVSSGINLASSLNNMISGQQQITGPFDQQDNIKAATDTVNMTVSMLLENPKAKTAFRVAAENQLSHIEKQLEASTAEIVKPVEDMQERTNKHIRDLEDDISKKLTTSRLSSTKVVKDLQASLEEQKQVIKSLTAQLKKLEKDVKK